MASALANLVKAHQRQLSAPLAVIPRLEQHLAMTVQDDRRDGMFHPSDISQPNFCPRAWSLFNFHPGGLSVKSAGVDPRLQRIFGNGHGVHDRFQRYFADAGLLWGTWSYPNKLSRDYQGVRAARDHIYNETKLTHVDLRIIGATDGLLVPDGQVVGLELKSMNSQGFKWLQGPREAHKNQVYIYMACYDDMRRRKIALPGALSGYAVLYECKDTQSLKEFFVPYDRPAIDQYIASLTPALHAALEHERTSQHPTCTCPTGKENILCKTL